MKKLLVKFKNFLFSLLFKMRIFFIKTKKNDFILCFDCLYDKNQECIDAFSFFEYLKKNNFKAKYVALKKSCSFEKLKKYDDVIFVNDRWDFVFKYTKMILSAKAIVTGFGLLCGLDKIIKKNNKNYIYIEHGVIFHQEFIDKIYSSENFNKILVPTKYTYELYKNNFAWDEKNMILSGLPRWDKYNLADTNKNIFVFFTWRKAFLDNKDSSLYFSSINSFLDFLCENVPKDIKITFAWHHEIYKNNFKVPILNSKINLIKPEEFSLNIQNSSMLITDYSSVFWDYFYRNKPVVFYNPVNRNIYNRIDIKIEDNISEFKTRIYNCFDNSSEAIEKIFYYINSGYDLEFEYRNINANFFFGKESNCEKIIDKIK